MVNASFYLSVTQFVFLGKLDVPLHRQELYFSFSVLAFYLVM